MLGLTCHLRELKSVDIVLVFFFSDMQGLEQQNFTRNTRIAYPREARGKIKGKKPLGQRKYMKKNIKKTKQKERKRKTSSSKNQTQHILCIGAILYVELPQARAVPKTFSCLDKTAGYFFIVETTQKKLHSGTGKNYHLTPRQLSRNKPVQCVFISSTRYLIASL